LSENLSREDRLSIEGRYYEAIKNWSKAVEVYHTLWNFAPDNLDYGLRLAQAQTSGTLNKDAMATLELLRNLPAPASKDPRIDLAEIVAVHGQSEFKRELAAALRATEKGQKLGARLLVARAEMGQARAYYDLGDVQQFQKAAETSRQIYAEAGDLGGEARALHDLGTVLYEHGDLAGAQKNQQEALDTCRKIGNQRCVSDALNSIGIAFKDQMDFTNARQAYEQSVAIRRETGDRIGEAVSLNNIAVLLYQQGKFAAARKLYEQSLAITQEIGEKRGIARALTKFGDCVSRAGPARGVQQVAGTIHRYPPRDWR